MRFKPLHQYGHHSDSALWKFISGRYMKKSAELTTLKSEETVLDFGCGGKNLKKFLPDDITYIGFDIDSKKTDMKDYQTTKPDVVFSLHCLEHLNEKELEQFIVFCKKKKVREIIIGLPFDHFFVKLFQFFNKKYFQTEIEHIQDYKKVMAKLSHYFINDRIELVDFNTILSVWKPR
jgi:2-polyprenyl-3-methyl-5-hydroxy-6-metoxy-1,4-benzoquinol methylase